MRKKVPQCGGVEVLTAVNMKITAFRDSKPYNLVKSTTVSEGPAVSTFYSEGGNSKFLRNTSTFLQEPHQYLHGTHGGRQIVCFFA
jgi:hypothetical protein